MRLLISVLRARFSSVSFDSVAGLASERFGCTSLWVEANDSDAFSYPVFGDYDSGAV